MIQNQNQQNNNNNNNNNNLNIGNNIDMIEIDGGIQSIDGFMQDKYKDVLRQINNHSLLFQALFSLDILSTLGFVLYIFLTDSYVELLIIILSIYIVFTFMNIMNISLLKRQSKTPQGAIKFFFIQFFFIILLCLKISKELTPFQYKNTSPFLLRVRYQQLVKWYSIKRFYLLTKSYTFLIFWIYNSYLVDGINSSIFIAYFTFQSFFYTIINHFYLKLFVFQSKLTFFQNLLILLESIIQFAQSYCYFIAMLYHPVLRITIFCFLIVYTTIIKCQVQHQGYFNPLCIDLFQQIFMGQKLTYIATLFNGDINQQDIMFMNVFNIVQFIVAQLYSVINVVIILYYKTEEFPEYLVNLQVALLIASLLFMLLKIIQIKNRFIQSKSYSLQHIKSIDCKQIKNRKCKLNLYISSRVEVNDWDQIKNLLNLDCKQFYLGFTDQYAVKKVLGYSILQIKDFESACLQNTFTHLLQNSIYFNVKINHENPDLQQSKNRKAISFLFNSLKSISIEDQKVINLEKSDLVEYFQKENYYGEIKQILRDFNYEKILINTIAYYNHISHYQYINRAMVLFDLYDND